MAKNRKDIENDILIEERIGEEEDYEEYARLREEREGIRARKTRIEEENERRQNAEYERRKSRKAEEERIREEEKRWRSYERRKKKKHPIRNFFLFLFVLIIALSGAFLIYMRSLLQTVDSVDLENALESSISPQVQDDRVMAGYQNIALFGVDSRDQDLLSGDNRSDTIMICSINKKTGETRLVSVYRDTLLNIGGGDFRKCNAAYAFGGPQQAVAMLNANLDLNITDFVTVGFEGLAETIDALGGIDLEITEEEMEYMNSYMDDMYYEIGTEYDEVTDWGMQHLSGIQATAYCRIRYTAGDDFRRAERQRTVLMLTMEKARKANPLRLAAAAGAVMGRTATSLSSGELMLFILRARMMDITESTGFPTEEDRIFATVNGESCVVPYYLTTNVRKLHQTLFDQEDYEPSPTVQDFNEIINEYVD
ncbi:MAG: LCP family protein [Lachnospiraceae bacterium]|nr:LCP family protein [Lachnospiraceae bacterium]MBQ8329652.1 LCP family protein [Lachnospiraceae bacterium]